MPSSIVLTAVFVLVVSVRDFTFRPTPFASASFIISPTTEALPNREIEHWHLADIEGMPANVRFRKKSGHSEWEIGLREGRVITWLISSN
jgi:hypothetical protein